MNRNLNLDEQPVVDQAPAPEQPVVDQAPAPEQPVVDQAPAPEQPVVDQAPAPEQPVVDQAPAPEQPAQLIARPTWFSLPARALASVLGVVVRGYVFVTQSVNHGFQAVTAAINQVRAFAAATYNFMMQPFRPQPAPLTELSRQIAQHRRDMAVAKASSKHVLQIAKNIHQRRLAADPAISWTDAQQPVLEQTSHFAMTQAANAVTSYEALAVSRTRLLELNTGIQADENINDAYKAKAARLVRAYQPVSGAYAAAPQHYNCLAAELMARDIGPKKGCVYGFNHSIFDMNQVVEPEAQDPAVLAIRQHVPEQLTPAQRAHIDASERLVLFSAAIKEASAARFPRPVQA